MEEFVEFRVAEELAGLLFHENEGRRLGSFTRSVTISPKDPRFPRIGELQAASRARGGRPFFAGCWFKRRYTPSELASAPWFLVVERSFFEPEGEYLGTIYDESVACAHCGSGARMVPPLRLDTRRIPKSKDFSTSIASEQVASERAVKLFRDSGLTGLDFVPVQPARPGGPTWFHLLPQADEVEVVEPTRWGINPFDFDAAGKYRCPLGHHPGLTLLSEVSFRGGLGDVLVTRQYMGVRRGVLRPTRLLIISGRFYELIRKHRLLGWGFEIAHQLPMNAASESSGNRS